MSDIRNDFEIVDLSRDFMRGDVGIIFACNAHGVFNTLLDKVEAHDGYIDNVTYSEWQDDGNGGPPATIKTPTQRTTREDCEKLFRKKLQEVQ